MNTQEIKEVYDKYVIPNYIRNPILLEKGSGVDVWDAEGKRYLDLFSGWAVSLLGHCHPHVVEAIQRQAAKLQHAPNIYYTEPQGLLAKHISEKSFGGQCFFCNSGAEANEAAIKLARIHNSHTGKYKIITFADSFHGRTIATVTATAQPKYHKGFAPLVEGFSYVPFNDLEALKKSVDDKTCAIMLEPIQGEGGINIATKDFLQGVRKLCNEKGLLLILDEVQCGMGRTGKYFAYQHYGIEPDIMSLAKALGGGVAIGAMVAGKEIAKSLVPGSHASTFGGNPLACAAAIAVFETIEKENLLNNAKEMGSYSVEQLKSLQKTQGIIREVRGIGLMIGIELTVNGADLIKKCIQAGLFLNCTHDKVIRFMPPLNVKKQHIDEGLNILKTVLSKP
ncbi:MAG: aspartate aminotransferase family protein [Candidatus Jettenia sp.]|uniref:Acetylornithine aminotransferase n=1 Tax=Candidatus Jettenia caeni TaxID=247490 RepID=I3IRA8_9BACT|nr:aspartate aminotransferase family protein [Candidatus Jettenia sp. AMX1]MBC6929451.1 aspartate aminotransferase family protein [Candidatus Jettenia sp.]NUN22871.1 aspartate aminotransferase family protein [Candidatus Jettenia caeni]KAA0249523.1 MAG: aspartate aminotransferase family protein [Candidatus Jettenia sp. AMX1]MCE7880852.1 aspartate aminotransferase family protein [Candidatus Jettenia sp. AMX1]MCQ3927636.1 aspartate aminotransferase family protein [Candidatus Jettenia sp.]